MNLSKRYSYNNYKNSIRRIDNNINDIRNDINDMKKKTENAFDILIQSLKNSQNSVNSLHNLINNNNENINDNNNYNEINNENNKDELKLNESYEINLLKENLQKEKILKRNSSQTEIPSLILNKYNKKFFNNYKSNNNINTYNNISKNNCSINSIGYELEILKLKKEIKCLKTKRLILQSTLNKKKQENIDVNLMINNYETGPNGKLLINIIKLLNLSNKNRIFDFDEFKEKIKEITLNKENLNLINEFIKGLNEIFINFYKDNKNINYENIYNMILNIIKNIDELKIDNENFIEGLNILNKEKKEYEIFCKNLMNDLQCKNFFELKEYIKELIIRDKYNKKQVDILKNILK